MQCLSPRRLAALAILGWAALIHPPALAHAIILDATPQVGAVVHGTSVDIRLRFNSRIDHARSRLSLIDAGGATSVIAITPDTAPDVIVASATIAGPGTYRLRWQVLALDGHITRGDIPFTVASP